ncbi:MAG: CoA transferase [Gammaproteobacteria bacterium]|jgi:CoA:oxalate CoA-transferase|nr:CoA transferase [Gammaproteobacteria bacterium]|tara:strand:- start:1066 stop:2229 length:1164 start_codon:yes stop_codon:yes gene_type:complete
MSHPLAGIKVLDLSRVLAGPFAGRMLSDLGADVVKLEPPEGDVTRHWGVKRGDISGYYHQQNAGKRNIAVDLRHPKGVEIVRSLVTQADVLIENFRPDVMQRLGLDYDTLAEINPRLIMLSISGFGANNPDSRRAAYAPIIHAETGLVARQAEITGAFPSELPLSVADTNAAMHGLIGLLAALYARQKSGRGDHVEIAMVDATIVTNDGMHSALEGLKVGVTNEVHETAGGLLMLAGEFRYIWKLLSSVYGVSDGLEGLRNAPLDEKIESRRAAARLFFTETCSNREEVITALDKMNIAWGDVRPASEVRELTSVKARGSIVEVDDRAGGTRSIPDSPYKFRHLESDVRAGAPHLGEHNEEVLRQWLDWSDEDISDVEAALLTSTTN